MQRRFIISLATLVTVLCVSAGMVNAQPPGGGGRGFGGRGGMFGGQRGGGMQMLSIPEVQKELKLTPEQITKLEAKQQEQRDAMREAFQSAGQDREAMQKMMADMQAMQKKAVNEILDANQQKRFGELELQQQGPMAIAARKDVAEALKITEEQKSKIEDIQRKSQEEMRNAMTGLDFRSMSPDDRQKMMTKMQDAQKATADKIAGVLTDDQKKQWASMLGEPFKFPAMQPGRGGFGGGRRQQGN
jgi:Spy/CpxP family protein refolding chaperone